MSSQDTFHLGGGDIVLGNFSLKTVLQQLGL